MRFSLLSILLATAIVGLTISFVVQSRSIKRLQTSLTKTEKMAGSLAIEDSTLVYARELECNVPNAWRFRFWIPESPPLVLHFGVYFGGTNNEKESFAKRISRRLQPGKNEVTIYLEPRVDGVWFAHSCVTESTTVHAGSFVPDHPIFTTVFSDKPRFIGRDNDSFPHGPMNSFDPNGTNVMPLVFFPKDASKKFPNKIDRPVGAAIWIGPPVNERLDQRNIDDLDKNDG